MAPKSSIPRIVEVAEFGKKKPKKESEIKDPTAKETPKTEE